jgi:6,7-dimethyl-8-ribityllumazine synthase
VPNDQPKIIEGELLARDLRFALIAARFNDFVVKQIEIVRVPGAFDIPIVARKLALSRRYEALIALGAVIRGQTPHFDYVAGECAGGIARIALESGVPIAFGVLTTDTVEQAVDRAGGKAGNKGADAALVAIEMANLLRRLEP